MTPEISQVLVELAHSLGTTTEYLWGILVVSAVPLTAIDAITSTVSTVISLICFVLCIKYSINIWNSACSVNLADGQQSVATAATFGIVFVGSIFFGVFSLIGLYITVSDISIMLKAIASPEHHALQTILQAIR